MGLLCGHPRDQSMSTLAISALAALNSEIKELEAAINADPRIVRLQELKRLRDAYIAMPSISVSAPSNLTVPSPSLGAPAIGDGARGTPGRKRSPERARALQETKSFLKGRTVPTKTADVLDHLERHKIINGGTDRQSNLSALLYHSREFQSHGKAGWTLK
jgi:hypothetical protein